MLTRGTHELRESLQARLLALRVAFLFCFAALAVGFWVVQVVQYTRYERMAANNHLRTIPLRAPRGILFDRNGEVLVQNRTSFTIAIVRDRSSDLDGAIGRLAAIAGVEEAGIRATVERHRRDAVFRPIPVIEHATFAQVAAVAARQAELPELLIQNVPTRSYPANALAAHLFGYVTEIREAQLHQPEFEGLEAGDLVGQTGLERTYNGRLMGEDGSRFVVVDSVGREIQTLDEQQPIDGEPLQLTIDYDVQRALEEAFRVSGFAGAGVLLEPSTGDVLALTSLPSYDPNAFAVGIDGRAFTALNTDPLRPFRNRAVQDRYPPGSTFKIVMAVAGLAERVTTTTERVYCPGSATFYGRRFRCNRPGGHGWMNVRDALKYSCNVFFYTIGDRLKVDTIHEYARRLGLVGLTGLDLPNEVESRVPTEAWKRRVYNDRWYPSETISVAIGQGAVDVTPIGLATMMATVANGGTLVTPHLIRARYDGEHWAPVPPPPARARVDLAPDMLAAVHDGLWRAVNADGGTAWRARVADRDVAGKTGTAQMISREGRAAAGQVARDLRPHGWFVFFAPHDDPQVAGVIFTEHGETAGTSVAIARHVLETFFAKREGRPLPPLDPNTIGRNTRAVASAQPAPPPAGTATPAPAGGEGDE
ncbi:MAG TPA: penicillin-binding protein 2 [Vicinamibacterales bacterium]|nr:penicillin-binding protein 2 [Vicinamibacterales bacterium]